MRKFHLILGLLLFLCVATNVNAQLMTPHYISALSHTTTTDSSGKLVATITETISGYASLAPGCCPSNITHTPHAYLTLNNKTTSGVGAPVCPSCNVYASTNQTFTFDPSTFTCMLDIVNPTECYMIETDSENVVCTLAGNFFSVVGASYFEWAYTQDKFLNLKYNCTTSQKTGITYCDYEVASWCTMSTTPPDLNPRAIAGSSLFPDPKYYDVYGFGVRFSTSMPFTFLNIDTYADEVYVDRLPTFCTKNQ